MVLIYDNRSRAGGGMLTRPTRVRRGGYRKIMHDSAGLQRGFILNQCVLDNIKSTRSISIHQDKYDQSSSSLCSCDVVRGRNKFSILSQFKSFTGIFYSSTTMVGVALTEAMKRCDKAADSCYPVYAADCVCERGATLEQACWQCRCGSGKAVVADNLKACGRRRFEKSKLNTFVMHSSCTD